MRDFVSDITWCEIHRYWDCGWLCALPLLLLLFTSLDTHTYPVIRLMDVQGSRWWIVSGCVLSLYKCTMSKLADCQ